MLTVYIVFRTSEYFPESFLIHSNQEEKAKKCLIFSGNIFVFGDD